MPDASKIFKNCQRTCSDGQTFTGQEICVFFLWEFPFCEQRQVELSPKLPLVAMLDLYVEFEKALDALEQRQINDAPCGGLAVTSKEI
ncbi:MAG: hypothetical protein ONB46_20740 [candidate division KSB1 bacterium]|nr:hypothetical protein [candidate division KSB1 bacterium]MDZ7368215.1 hypothetical protein [candidate division KSB1 bacterium]MDZ7403947.1 hypothetical protein [candidate division KSB1 bacterium]